MYPQSITLVILTLLYQFCSCNGQHWGKGREGPKGRGEREGGRDRGRGGREGRTEIGGKEGGTKGEGEWREGLRGGERESDGPRGRGREGRTEGAGGTEGEVKGREGQKGRGGREGQRGEGGERGKEREGRHGGRGKDEGGGSGRMALRYNLVLLDPLSNPLCNTYTTRSYMKLATLMKYICLT